MTLALPNDIGLDHRSQAAVLGATTTPETISTVQPASRTYFRLRRALIASTRRFSYVPLGASIVVTVVFWASWPLAAAVALAAGMTYYLALATAAATSDSVARWLIGGPGAPLDPVVTPNDIEPVDLRLLYQRVLTTHETVRVLLARSEDLRRRLQSTYDCCTELVQSAGRVAELANGVDRYLDEIGAHDIQRDAERLEARASSAHDRSTRQALMAAAAARRRQVDTYAQLRCVHDRARARMEMVLASLDSVHALAIKLRALDGEDLVMADGSVARQLELLCEDQRVVEAALVEVQGAATTTSGDDDDDEVDFTEAPLDSPKKRKRQRKASGSRVAHERGAVATCAPCSLAAVR